MTDCNSFEHCSGFAGTLVAEASEHSPKRPEGLRNQTFEIVLGTDDRRIETQTRLLPWRLICSLEIATPKGQFRGTGWLAGPRLVVTAGHCVYRQQEFGGWATRVRVVPGRSWEGQPFGDIVSSSLSCAPGWLQAGRREEDIGCIHLAEPVGETLGWFGFGAPDPAGLAGTAIVATGYPEYAGSYDNLLVGHGTVQAATAAQIFYDADTTDGQSGGPVWVETGAGPQVIAVHTYEPSPGIGAGFNAATLLTAGTLGLIADWQNGG